MLLWLEEAIVEIAMILATATGLVLLVAAVWHHVCEYLEGRARRRERVAGAPATTRRPSGHSA